MSVINHILTSAARGDVLAWISIAMFVVIVGGGVVGLIARIQRRPSKERWRLLIPWAVAFAVLFFLGNTLSLVGVH